MLEVTEGSNVTLYIPIPTKAKTLFQLTDSGASMPRYAVSAEELAASAGLFTFVLSNVSATDAGYYALGYDVQSCRTNHGVVLVVNGKNDKLCTCVFTHYIYKNEAKVPILFYFHICV